jgi:hypothetical protein
MTEDANSILVERRDSEPPWQLKRQIAAPLRQQPLEGLLSLCYEHLLRIRFLARGSSNEPSQADASAALMNSAIVALRSGELQGDMQPPYSTTFRDLTLWLKTHEGNPLWFRQNPWVASLLQSLETMVVPTVSEHNAEQNKSDVGKRITRRELTEMVQLECGIPDGNTAARQRVQYALDHRKLECIAGEIDRADAKAWLETQKRYSPY